MCSSLAGTGQTRSLIMDSFESERQAACRKSPEVKRAQGRLGQTSLLQKTICLSPRLLGRLTLPHDFRPTSQDPSAGKLLGPPFLKSDRHFKVFLGRYRHLLTSRPNRCTPLYRVGGYISHFYRGPTDTIHGWLNSHSIVGRRSILSIPISTAIPNNFT
jgi:hypothetical protein